MPSNTANLVARRAARRGLAVGLIGALIALFLYWRARRSAGKPKKAVAVPPAAPTAAVDAPPVTAGDATASEATVAVATDVPQPQASPSLPANATEAEEAEEAAGSGSSKRQEKKAQRKLAQKERNKAQPKVRTALERYSKFIAACVAHAGMAAEEVTEAFIEANYPKKYECHGHVVVVQLNVASGHGAPNPSLEVAAADALSPAEAAALEQFRRIAKAFAKSLQSNTDVVVVDTRGIGGELRKPIHEIVWQSDADDASHQSAEQCFAPVRAAAPKGRYDGYTPAVSFTTHIENKTRYSFDVMKVMFSSGNTEIRMHFGSAVRAEGETVVDMFAGIGYFTIPLAMHGGVKHLHALEKNPDSAEFLQMNAFQNGVADRVTVYCGDNRSVSGAALDGQCDRVLMGYIPSCKEFVPKAVQFLRRAPCEVEVEVEVSSPAPSPAPSPPRTTGAGKGRNRRGKGGNKSAATSASPAGTPADEEATAEVTSTTLVKQAKTITRPIGVIHYHFLAGKDDAEAVAMADMAFGLSAEQSHSAEGHDALLREGVDYRVTHMFQVKSYSPKVWHYVAEVTFGLLSSATPAE